MTCCTIGIPQTSIESRTVASLKKAFGDTISVEQKTIRIAQADKDSLSRLHVTPWNSDTIRAFACRSHGTTVGYGFLDDVKGKMQFITYLVEILPEGTVQDIDVLAYRESYGGEISYDSFRKQFRGKSSKDRLQPGRDIKNISGATISVHAITDGVKKVLATFGIMRQRLGY